MVAFFCVHTFFKKMWGEQEGHPSNIKTIQGIRYFFVILVKLYYLFYHYIGTKCLLITFIENSVLFVIMTIIYYSRLESMGGMLEMIHYSRLESIGGMLEMM